MTVENRTAIPEVIIAIGAVENDLTNSVDHLILCDQINQIPDPLPYGTRAILFTRDFGFGLIPATPEGTSVVPFSALEEAVRSEMAGKRVGLTEMMEMNAGRRCKEQKDIETYESRREEMENILRAAPVELWSSIIERLRGPIIAVGGDCGRPMMVGVVALSIEMGHSPILPSPYSGGNCVCVGPGGYSSERFKEVLVGAHQNQFISVPVCDDDDTYVNSLYPILGNGREIRVINSQGTLYIPPSLLTDEQRKRGVMLV